MSIAPRFTSADLERLPNIEGIRYEIIDGDLFVSKQPHWHHQYASDAVLRALWEGDRQTGWGVAISAPGLVFAADDDVIPDVVWISHARLAAVVDEAGHLRDAPELVVEVLSPGSENERRDRELKLRLYSRRGVQEYWIVDWRRRTVQVYRRELADPSTGSGQALHPVATLAGEDVLTTPLLPDFACPIGAP